MPDLAEYRRKRNFDRTPEPAGTARRKRGFSFVVQKHAARFGKVPLFTIDEVFGGWTKTQKAHFDDGGTFDQIYLPQ